MQMRWGVREMSNSQRGGMLIATCGRHWTEGLVALNAVTSIMRSNAPRLWQRERLGAHGPVHGPCRPVVLDCVGVAHVPAVLLAEELGTLGGRRGADVKRGDARGDRVVTGVVSGVVTGVLTGWRERQWGGAINHSPSSHALPPSCPAMIHPSHLCLPPHLDDLVLQHQHLPLTVRKHGLQLAPAGEQRWMV